VLVPTKALSGVKVTTPVVVLTAYVPSLATTTEVAEQLFGTWAAEQSLTVEGLKVAPVEGLSFRIGLAD
jgi:hypothetical protein